jgi:hypothetical protein
VNSKFPKSEDIKYIEEMEIINTEDIIKRIVNGDLKVILAI